MTDQEVREMQRVLDLTKENRTPAQQDWLDRRIVGMTWTTRPARRNF
jgi:hypothetical protein